MATTDFVVKNGLVVTENAVINEITDASSKDTGALVVEGGVGIEKKLYVGTDLNVGNNSILSGDLALNGGDLTTTSATFNLVNTTATTVNLAGTATNIQIGSASGTTNVNNNLDVDGDVNIDGGDLTVSTGTFNLVNTTATIVNAFGAGTSVTLGATTGTTNIRNNLNVTGDLDIDGGDLTVSTGTFNLANTTATNVNFAQAASALTMGATTGTTTIRNANTIVTGDLAVNGGDLTTGATTFNLLNSTVTTGNLFGAGTAVTIGAATGTTTIRNANTVVTGDLAVNGGDLTTGATTFNLVNSTATTVNLAGAATSLNLGATAGTGTTTVKNSFKADGIVELGSIEANSVTINAGTINVPNSVTLTKNDAVNDNIAYPAILQHTTSGVPINGIGTGIQFITETGNNNNEIGAIVESVSTSVASGSENFDLVFKLMTNGAAPSEKIRFTSTGNIAVNGGLTIGNGDLSTSQSTFNLINTTATTVNFAGAATTLTMGATTGTTNIRNNLNVTGDLDIDGGDLTVSTGTFNLANTTATTVNAFGAATALTLGSTSGTTTIQNPNLILLGDVDVRGGDLTTNQTTFNLVNATATTVNMAGAGTAVAIGATTGTTTIRNATTTITGNANVNGGSLSSSQTTFNLLNSTTSAVNFAGAGTAVTIGATTGTTTIRNANTVVTGDLAVNGGDLTTGATIFNLLDNTVTTGNLFGAATTVNIGSAGSAGVLTIKNDNTVVTGDLAINGGDLTTNQNTFNLLNSTVTTGNLFGAGSAVTIGATIGTTTIRNANTVVTGDLAVNGGDLTTGATTFNLLNSTVTTGNLFGAGTAVTIGATIGTTTIRNANTVVTGDLAVNGGDLTTGATIFNLLNSVVTTANVLGAATTLTVGAATGTTTIRNNLSVNGSATLGDNTSDEVTFNASTVNLPNTITFTEDDATNNAISYPVTFRHTTSGTPANGIGTGINFATETANGNNEIGAVIEAVTTDVTATSEDFDLVIKTMAAGGAAAERIRFTSTGLTAIPSGGSLSVPVISDVSTINFAASAGDSASISTTINGSSTYFDFNLTDDNNQEQWRWRFTPSGSTVYDAMTVVPVANGVANLLVSGDVAVNGGDLTTSQTTFNLINTTATTLNIGGAADTVNIGKSSGNVVVAGNLVVNGTTTTINSTELTVDDKNIELGSVATPTNITADGGGITLKGTTDKTINWSSANTAWTSSENFDLANGRTYKINQSDVLSSTTLGSSVVSSSLTTVGTIGSGRWQGTIIDSTYGGTGVNNGGRTFTIGGNFAHVGAHSLTLNTTANTSVILPTSGTLATTGNLSQFASTTSVQLAGIISDETGSGALVFATSPTFTTSLLTNSASFSLFNTTATTLNAFGAATTLNLASSVAAQTVSIGSGSTGASTYNFGTGATANATIKTLNLGTGGISGSTTNINIGSSNAGSVTINSSTLVGAVATQNLFNATATTLNIGGSATAFNAGATSGTMTLRNPTIVGSQTTQNLFNTVATTMNFAQAATLLTLGATTGTTTVRNNLTVTGDLDIDGGDLTVGTTTFNLANTTATTVNFAQAASTLTIGATGGTTNIRNNLDVDGDVNIDGGDLTVSTGTFNLANTTATTGNLFGAGTAVTIGATSGTTTIRNANTVVSGDLEVSGADITTTSTGASSIFNANTVTLNLAQAATTITMGATSGTTTIRNNLLVNGNSTLGDVSTDSIIFNSNSVSVPNTVLFTVEDAVTNNISYPVKLQHTTSGTPANGIGTGLQFITETTVNNNEIGSTIESVATDITGASEDFDLVFKTMAAGAAASEALRITNIGNGIFVGDVEVRGGDLTTNQATFNLINTTATTLNIGGAATAFNAGATTGTMTLRSPTIVGSQTTQNLFNATATTLNIGGAATAFNAGATTGTMTLRSPTIVGSQPTQSLFNTTATTLNIGGSATAFNAGATTGTMTLRSPTIVGSQTTQNLFNTTASTMNFAQAATTLTMGATSGTTTVRNNLTVTGDLDIDGGDLTVGTTTFNLANATATTVNFAQAATALNMGATTGTTSIRNLVTLPVDSTDVLDFTANSTNDNRGISFNGRTAVSADFNDGYLRLNNASEFTNGVYVANYLGVAAGANTSYTFTVGGAAEGKAVLTGSANPFIRWQEGTTDRFYIQWNAGLNGPVFYNQEARDHYFDTAVTTNIGIHLRTAGTDRGWVYADSTNNVGFLDSTSNWAIKHTLNNGTYFYTDTATEEFRVGRDTVTGDYGTVQTSSNKGGWGGYSIGGRVVFMHDNANDWGIYNDVNNEWLINGSINGDVELFFDGASKLQTTTTGVNVTGLLTATTKSFKIDHPTKQGMSLQYACLEGPENGVYVRGKLKDSNVIELPDYWLGLVDADSITVSITPRGRKQEIYVADIVDNAVYLNGENIDCFYVVYGERKDVEKLLVEIQE